MKLNSQNTTEEMQTSAKERSIAMLEECFRRANECTIREEQLESLFADFASFATVLAGLIQALAIPSQFVNVNNSSCEKLSDVAVEVAHGVRATRMARQSGSN